MLSTVSVLKGELLKRCYMIALSASARLDATTPPLVCSRPYDTLISYKPFFFFAILAAFVPCAVELNLLPFLLAPSWCSCHIRSSTHLTTTMDARAVMDPAALAAELASLPPDTNRKNIILRTVWILLAFSTIIMFARIYVKCKTVRRIYYDDALMVVAMVCVCSDNSFPCLVLLTHIKLMGYAHASSITRACETGLGRHIFYLTDHERATTLRAGFFSLVWGFLSPLAGRLGFCTFLLFVAGMDPLIKKWPLWTVMILQVLINVTSILVLFLQCGKQLDIIWNPAKAALLTEVCWNPDIQSDYNYFAGSFNTVTDLFLTILPAVIIHHTKMSLRAKLGLAFLLCLSVLYASTLSELARFIAYAAYRAMIASIVKTYEARVLSEYLDYTCTSLPCLNRPTCCY